METLSADLPDTVTCPSCGSDMSLTWMTLDPELVGKYACMAKWSEPCGCENRHTCGRCRGSGMVVVECVGTAERRSEYA